jgi:hypothetical protein
MPLFSRSGPTNLGRYWTALVQGAPAIELERLAAGLDPATLATIERMRGIRNDLRPDPTFANQLEVHLMNVHAHALPTQQDFDQSHRRNRRDQPGVRRSMSGSPALARITGRWLAVAGTAALVLALIGGIGAAWRFSSWGESGPSRGGPAIYAPGTPSTDATPTDEPLAVETTPTAATTVEGMAAEFEGTWLVTASTDGQITKHVVSLTADGVAIVNGMPAQPLPGGESGAALVSTCLGAWEPSSTNTANITCVRYRASAEGQPLGTVTVSMNITSGFFNTTAGEGSSVATVVDAEGDTVATIVSGLTITKLFAQAPVIPYPDETPST